MHAVTWFGGNSRSAKTLAIRRAKRYRQLGTIVRSKFFFGMMETVNDCRFSRVLERRKRLRLCINLGEAVHISDILDDLQRNVRNHPRVPMQVSAGIAIKHPVRFLFPNTQVVGL